MNTASNKDHWEHIYTTKSPEELSWTEAVPGISLSLIQGFHLPGTASIIDIGAGESGLAGFLLDAGYSKISVLDISETSIQKAKATLGKRSDQINWIAQDVTEFRTNEQFDCWHDRATFHFLTTNEQISKYTSLAKQYVKPGGYLIVGTFSKKGPEKCSGLSIKQYDQQEMSVTFADGFKTLGCRSQEHETPFKTKQHFTFCTFQRI